MRSAPDMTARPGTATLLAFAGVVVLGGLNAIAVRVTVQELAPFWSGALRFAVAGVLLLAVAVALGRALPRGLGLAGAALYGAIGFAGSIGFFYPGLREVPASTAIVFLALVPLETFGLAILQRQEPFRVEGLVGAAVALIGVVVVVADGLGGNVPLLPMAQVLIGTLLVAESAVILKAIPRSDPVVTTGVAMTAGGAIFLALSALIGEPWQLPGDARTWVASVYLIFLGSAAMYGLFVFAVGRWTASAVSYATLLMPLVTIPVAAVLVGEGISPLFVVGSAIALIGVYIGAFQRIRTGRPAAVGESLPVEAGGGSA